MSDKNPFMEGLNAPQREAVGHGEGALLVLSGPGSGKTTVIVRRIRYLVSQMHVPPEQILVITFTKAAAKSMRDRFYQQLPQESPQAYPALRRQVCPVNFGTFHSAFYHILLHSNSVFSGGAREPFCEGAREPQILSEAQKRNLIIPLLRERQQKIGRKDFDADFLAADAAEWLSAVSFYKNTEDEAGAVKRLSFAWRPYFQEVFAAYQGRIRQSGSLDFDDMVYECRRLLTEDRELRERWQKRFSHILMDEFQDINPMQYQVIRLLAGEPCNLFAVGDDDQSIYGFRGSRPSCLRQFSEEFHAKHVLLNINYRSGKQIVGASGKVISENNGRFQKNLSATPNAAEDAVEIRSFPEREQQNLYLRGQIEEFQKNYPGKSCAVLFRTNTFLRSFGAGLAKAGINYVTHEKEKSVYEHFIVRDVTAYLRFAAGERQRALFLQIMNKPSRYLRRDALAGMEIIDFQKLEQWYREYGGGRRMEYLNAVDRLRTQMQALRKMPPYLAVQYVCKSIGYEAYLREHTGGREEKLQEWLDLLAWLKEDAKDYETVSEWVEAQRHNADPPEKGYTQKESQNAVQLMTVHAAKGLEFDKVWIPDCNERIFPHGDMADPETVEEERRIFYVGMTRAKESLELLYLTGTAERPRLMSRFLNPLVKDYSSINSSNSQLSRYSSKASSTFSYSSSSSM